jgi:hypothetical protein
MKDSSSFDEAHDASSRMGNRKINLWVSVKRVCPLRIMLTL